MPQTKLGWYEEKRLREERENSGAARQIDPAERSRLLQAARVQRERANKKARKAEKTKNRQAERKRLKAAKRSARKFSWGHNDERWMKLRYEAIKLHGARCQCCGASPAEGAVLNVDHIKPRHKYPELTYEIGNLQVLCSRCNHGKGGSDQTDWRADWMTSAFKETMRQ